MNTQKKNQPLIICKVFLSVIAIILLCSCSQVKTNPVRVNQTPSDSDAFVIQVSRDGRYYVYIPNETDRLKTTLLRNSKSPTEDSVWEVKLADIRNNILGAIWDGNNTFSSLLNSKAALIELLIAKYLNAL